MERKLPPLASKWLEDLLVPIDSIKPHPDNYKDHPDDQLDSLNASLLAFGWTKPICANPQGYIVAGHGMYLEALRKGYTHVPVEPLAFDKNQSKAYLVADNELSRKGITDQDKLSGLVADISTFPEFDINAIGISAEDLDLDFNEFTQKGPEEEAEEEAENAVKEYINIEKDSIKIFHAAAGDSVGCVDYFNYLISYTQDQPLLKHPMPPHSLLFVDSGALSGVRKYGPSYLSLETQEKIVKHAEDHDANWVTMLDVPMIPQVLEPLGMSRDEAYKIHLKHARAFKEINTEVRKVYVIQGPQMADFKQCCIDMQPLITNEDVVAIGTLKTRAGDADTIEKITALVHSYFPNNDIHLFGVTSTETIARAIQVGATSCDSASVGVLSRSGKVAELIITNNGNYSISGNTLLTDYCKTDLPISQSPSIRIGSYIFGIFNVNLSILLEIQKQKALHESN